MPILARFLKAVAIAFLEISKISTVNSEIRSFFSFVQKFLFSSDTNSCREKLNPG